MNLTSEQLLYLTAILRYAIERLDDINDHFNGDGDRIFIDEVEVDELVLEDVEGIARAFGIKL